LSCFLFVIKSSVFVTLFQHALFYFHRRACSADRKIAAKKDEMSQLVARHRDSSNKKGTRYLLPAEPELIFSKQCCKLLLDERFL
jgi:hypothetical protein